MAPSPPRRPSHRVVCVGVSGKSDQGFPEASAEAIFTRLTGATGPTLARATCLTGPSATRKAVTDELAIEPQERSPFSFMYFSGAANGHGLRVSDGYVDGAVVLHHVERAAAERVLVVLEIAAGTRPDAELVPAWAARMAKTRPGVGLAATRATRIGQGAEGAGLGRFAAAFLKALDTAVGDMDLEGEAFISDRRAFDAAREELRRRFGVTHVPEQHGEIGGFPLARCQAKRSLGSAEVTGVAFGKGVSLLVRFSTQGRAGVPTRVRVEMLDATDERLDEREVSVVPTANAHSARVRIRLGREAIAAHPVWGPSLQIGDRVYVRFRVSLLDAAGRVLDRRAYGHEVAGLVR